MQVPRPQDPNSAPREQEYDEFVSLLARHDLTIRRFVRSLMPSRDGVDDVVQETALECWKKFSDFQPKTPHDAAEEFIRWACVIARFKVLSWQRDKARDRLVLRESVVDRLSETAINSLTQREQEREAVESCLDKLPMDQRQLVLSVHTPGESVARIASKTGQRARRLYSRVNALRKMLLDCVQQQVTGEGNHG